MLECIDSGWISFEGPFVERFENEFASYHGVRHGVTVSNGTAALELAFAALELQPGDEVRFFQREDIVQLLEENNFKLLHVESFMNDKPLDDTIWAGIAFAKAK